MPSAFPAASNGVGGSSLEPAALIGSLDAFDSALNFVASSPIAFMRLESDLDAVFMMLSISLDSKARSISSEPSSRSSYVPIAFDASLAILPAFFALPSPGIVESATPPRPVASLATCCPPPIFSPVISSTPVMPSNIFSEFCMAFLPAARGIPIPGIADRPRSKSMSLTIEPVSGVTQLDTFSLTSLNESSKSPPKRALRPPPIAPAAFPTVLSHSQSIPDPTP